MLAPAKIDSNLNVTLDTIATILAKHDVFNESAGLSKGKQRFKEAFIGHILSDETESFEIIYREKGVRLIIPFITENDVVTLTEIQVYDRPNRSKTPYMSLATELSILING